jgi:hypothetical protein
MNLIPRPDQMVAASANLARTLLHGGVAALSTTWRVLDGWLGGHASARAGEPVIGSNPERRFSSASSRSLATAGRRQGRSAR